MNWNPPQDLKLTDKQNPFGFDYIGVIEQCNFKNEIRMFFWVEMKDCIPIPQTVAIFRVKLK